LKDGCDYVLLLNNDIIVTEGFLEPLIQVAKEKQKVAAVGGIIYEYGTEKIWDAGGEMRPKRASKIRYNEIISEYPYETEFVTCAMNLLTRDFLKDHRLDEGYFFGMEEVDLSWRACENGWNLFITPDSKVSHKVGNSTDPEASESGILTEFQHYHKTRGHLRLASTRFSRKQQTVFLLSNILIYCPYFLMIRVLQGRFNSIYVYSLALIDYIVGRPPRRPSEFESLSE
jgi:GT2 family glycosyltransferase